jgi:hypothetical protein
MSLPFCRRLKATDTFSGTAAPAAFGKYAATRAADRRRALTVHTLPAAVRGHEGSKPHGRKVQLMGQDPKQGVHVQLGVFERLNVPVNLL